jgi:hypothetical protein
MQFSIVQRNQRYRGEERGAPCIIQDIQGPTLLAQIAHTSCNLQKTISFVHTSATQSIAISASRAIVAVPRRKDLCKRPTTAAASFTDIFWCCQPLVD